MGKPEHSQRGRGPLGVGTTYSMDGRRNVNQDDGGTMGPPLPHPPATTKYFRVWFGWANGHPALYEYEVQTHWFWGLQIHEPYLRKRDLTFKPRKTRDWYEVGDLVLYEEISERRLIERYPELAPPPGEEKSLLAMLALGLLLGPPEDFKLAHKITRITPGSDGNGKIELTPVLILDDKTFIELEEKAVRSQLELNGWWGANHISRTFFAVMKPVSVFFYEATMAMATGGVGSVARGGGRGALLFTLRQARRRVATRILARKLVTYLKKDTSKATIAATKAFAAIFAKVYHAETSKQGLADQARRSKKVDRRAFDVALKKASGAFAATFITTLLGIGLDKMLKDSGYGEIQQEMTKRITAAFGTNIPATLINAIAAAWAAEEQHPGTFADSLGRALVDALKASFTSLVQVDFKKIGESLAK